MSSILSAFLKDDRETTKQGWNGKQSVIVTDWKALSSPIFSLIWLTNKNSIGHLVHAPFLSVTRVSESATVLLLMQVYLLHLACTYKLTLVKFNSSSICLFFLTMLQIHCMKSRLHSLCLDSYFWRSYFVMHILCSHRATE